MTRVLWLDDNIEKYNFILEALEATGLAITPARSTTDALSLLETRFDVYLLDIKLAEDADGVDFAEKIRVREPQASLVFLSAYLQQEYWRKRLEAIDAPAGILEKDFAGDVTAVADSLAQQIRKWAAREPKFRPAEYYAWKMEAVDLDPFRLGRTRFEELPEYQQDQLSIRVRKEAAPAINAAFEDGAVWVLISGSRNIPVAKRDRIEDIPDQKEFREITRTLKNAYYEFERNYGTEGLAWSGSCTSADLKKYPTLTLLLEDITVGDEDEVSEDARSERRRVHFDTGSSDTMLDYEMLVEFGLMPPNRRRSHMQREETGQDFFASHERIPLLFEEDTRAAVPRGVGVVLSVLAVRDWWNSPWIRECIAGCDAGIERKRRRLCINRCGLLGRNVLTEGEIAVELNGATGDVKVRKHDLQ